MIHIFFFFDCIYTFFFLLFFVFGWYEVGTRMVFILCFWVVNLKHLELSQVHVLRAKRGLFLSVVLAWCG